MNSKPSFGRASLQTLVVRLVLLTANLAGGVILARWLMPENLGIYFLIVLMPHLAFRFGNLGFGSAISFFAARRQAALWRLARLTWILGLLLGTAGTLAVLVVRPWSAFPWHDLDPVLIYLFLPAIFLQFWILYAQRLLSGVLRYTAVNMSQAVNGFGLLFMQVLFVIVWDGGLKGALIAALIAQAATVLFLLIQARTIVMQMEPHITAGSDPLVGPLWRYGRWNYLIMLTDYLYAQLPLFVLKYFFPNQVVGFFSLARSLEHKTQVLLLPFSTFLLSFTAASSKQEAVRRTNTLCRLSMLGMLCLTVALLLTVKVVILVVYGDPYLPAVAVIYALAWGIFVWPLGQFPVIHVAGSGKPKWAFLGNVIALITAVPICMFLIPEWGAVGAGMSISIIYSVRALTQLVIYRRLTGAAWSEFLVPRKEDISNGFRVLRNSMSQLHQDE